LYDLPVKIGNPHFKREAAVGLDILDITTGNDPEEFFGTVDDPWSAGILHP
jgi:hypothetical protein